LFEDAPVTSADDLPPDTGLRIGRWVPDVADTTSRHGARRHTDRRAPVRHDPAVHAPTPERAPAPASRSGRLSRRRRRLLAMGLTGVVSAGSVAALLRPTAEPAEFYADSVAVGVTDPGRLNPAAGPAGSSSPAGSWPLAGSSLTVGSSPSVGSGRTTLPSGSPSAPGRTPRSAEASAKPTTAPAMVTVLSAQREKDLRSIETDKRTEIDFVNHRDESVVIYWLDYQGARERYLVLDSGAIRQQPTFVGHPWVITTMGGHSLAVILPADRPAQATIT
jgi:hypothetical protein